MLLIYDGTGEIKSAILNRDSFTNNDVNVFEIDEVLGNAELIKDIALVYPVRNELSQGKYYVLNRELYMREDWIGIP